MEHDVARIIEQVGTVAWEAALRQVYVNAGQSAAFALVVVVAAWKFIPWARKDRSEYDDAMLGVIGGGALLGVAFVISLLWLGDAIGGLFNPTYAAMNHLGALVSR
jgi:uncharacterized membrane protein YkvI